MITTEDQTPVLVNIKKLYIQLRPLVYGRKHFLSFVPNWRDHSVISL